LIESRQVRECSADRARIGVEPGRLSADTDLSGNQKPSGNEMQLGSIVPDEPGDIRDEDGV